MNTGRFIINKCFALRNTHAERGRVSDSFRCARVRIPPEGLGNCEAINYENERCLL